MNRSNLIKEKELAKDLVEKATDPRQYDLPQLDWGKGREIGSPVRQAFYEYLQENLEDLTGKSVIDIGSGTGHFSKFLFEYGAKEVYGIEPSHKNAEISEALFPDMVVIEQTLEEAEPGKIFDIATVILAFEHMGNLQVAFSKISELIKIHGSLYAILGDKDYYTTERFGYKLTTEVLSNDEIVVATERPYGIMYDIFRSTSGFIEAAQEAGFLLKKHVPIMPTEELIQAKPRYKQFEGKAMDHLFVFEYTGETE